jgi:hypothetical protein
MQPEVLVTGYEKQKNFMQVALPVPAAPLDLHFEPLENNTHCIYYRETECAGGGVVGVVVTDCDTY